MLNNIPYVYEIKDNKLTRQTVLLIRAYWFILLNKWTMSGQKT